MSDNDFMTADEFGRSLKGFGINLLVQDVFGSVKFAEIILQATCDYQDKAFAAMHRGDVIWQYHADFTYKTHALSGFVKDDKGEALKGRGAGAEFHFFDLDPDEAVKRAKGGDYIVLAEAMDKPHGLREAYILDDDGYCWVVSLPLS